MDVANLNFSPLMRTCSHHCGSAAGSGKARTLLFNGYKGPEIALAFQDSKAYLRKGPNYLTTRGSGHNCMAVINYAGNHDVQPGMQILT